jgi:protein-S-isoprenylcysteine O-methyltransferase Ste14
MISLMNIKQLELCIIVVFFYAAVGGCASLIAGRIDLPFFWAVFVVQMLVGLVSVFVLEPDLISERITPRGKDEDPRATLVLSILLLLGLVISAVDVGRFHVSDNVPQFLQGVFLLLSAAGWAGFIWSMSVNRFFSSAIRLQSDRGQTVIESGPYRFVRHPGYATASLALLSQSIALGSWLGVLPTVVLVIVLMKRTIFEEEFLLEQLDGYKEYVQSVRWRWYPGIW